MVPQKDKKSTTRPQITYKGVEKETQVAVRKAAKKANQKIGEWVNRTLLVAAQEEIQNKIFKPPMDIQKELKHQRDMLEQMAGKLDTLVNKPNILEKVFKSIPKRK